MKNNKACPKCNSKDVKSVDYIGMKCIVCNKCGYDETRLYDVYPEQKKGKKEKAGYSPYKAGGSGRARKS